MNDSKSKLEKFSQMMRNLWEECRGKEDFCFRCSFCGFCDEGLTPEEIADAIDDYMYRHLRLCRRSRMVMGTAILIWRTDDEQDKN